MTEQTHSISYENAMFGVTKSTDSGIVQLFENLARLDPMDKNGPMSGRCGRQTDQMEQFLKQTFGFHNIPGQYIVDGVRSFKLDKPPHSLSSDTKIHFPSETDDLFAMTAKEIKAWQASYRVYADKNIEGMNNEFLSRALQGQSRDGEEAFRMKFVVRISTCPILMEFDAKIISRKLDEDWPHRIKLVSVTGIDFAGRKHDVGDILYYISNWRDVFKLDPRTNLPMAYNGRDFDPNTDKLPAQLYEERLLDSLTRMVRLRLRACDAEGIQVVVETGIGLGVFAGTYIGIDGQVRKYSAEAIRTVLEQDGLSYKNILAIVLALPIFNRDKANRRAPDTFDDFVDAFRKTNYAGTIPVLIADQDMHRLTVATARHGFIVSELNPADSHGVFGEYWQNRGPAVEEKLALTTVGLLVQHHLINPEVLNQNNYHLLDINEAKALSWESAIADDIHQQKTAVTCCNPL